MFWIARKNPIKMELPCWYACSKIRTAKWGELKTVLRKQNYPNKIKDAQIGKFSEIPIEVLLAEESVSETLILLLI